MQVTTGEALDALAALRELISCKMPFDAAMAVRKMIRELVQVAEDAEAERQKLIKDHAAVGEDGKLVTKVEMYVFVDQVAFEREYADLMASQLEVTTSLSAEGMENVEVEPGGLLGLGALLVE